MAIKKSSLEQKWYYRAAKVFFLILPLLIILLLFLKRKIVACGFVQKNFPELLLNYLVFIVIGLVLYYSLLKGIWRGFLYIAFGGLEDDTKKDSEQLAPISQKRAKIEQVIPFIVVLIVIAIMLLSEMGYITLPKINLNFFENLNVKPTHTPRSTCPITSAQMRTPCHSVKNGVGVSGVIVPASCNCPSDTTYAGMDNISSGGPYKICKCK